MTSSPVMAATAWKTNADLIAACAELGYLREDALTLDATFGRGVWWKKWRPERLVTSDGSKPAQLRADFRELPFPDRTFDAVAYDPPYVCPGGRKTTTIPDFHDRFGMSTTPKSPFELQKLIHQGLVEVTRVTKPGGTILVKSQDYVTSGKLWLGTHKLLNWALLSCNLELWDRLEHIGKVRPQPARTRLDGKPVRQQHARRNLSTMFVFRAR